MIGDRRSDAIAMATAHPLSWLPNALTLARCGLAGLVGSMILTAPVQTYWPFLVYALVAATDFIDGALARNLNAVSKLGAFLDPVADKLLVGFALAALTTRQDGALIYLIPTLAIITRDLIATGLRLIPSVDMPVSQLAKWKTGLEMVGIGGLLLAMGVQSQTLTSISLAIVWLAALLAIYTLGLYVRALIAKQNDRAND